MKTMPVILAAVFAALTVPAVYVGAVIAQEVNSLLLFPLPAVLCLLGAAYWIGVAE